MLLNAGASVNYQDEDGATPLHGACMGMRSLASACIPLLLEARADPLLPAYEGQSAMDLARTMLPAGADAVELLEAARPQAQRMPRPPASSRDAPRWGMSTE